MLSRSAILRRVLIASLFTLFIAVVWASDKIEEKLADALARANRTVAHDQEKAQEAGSKLDAHCKGKGERAGIRPADGLWGCVAIPVPPPGTNR